MSNMSLNSPPPTLKDHAVAQTDSIATLGPTEIYYTYLFVPSEFHRLPAILDATPPPTLIRMIHTLYYHITQLQTLNVQMYARHWSIMSCKDREKVIEGDMPKNLARQKVYTGERLTQMSRDGLLDVLEGEVEVYDGLVGKVNRWKGEVDGRIGKR
jgi:hypothetical protein